MVMAVEDNGEYVVVVDDDVVVDVVVVVVEDDCNDDGHLLVPGRACPLASSSTSSGARLQERAPAYCAFDQEHIYHHCCLPCCAGGKDN